jgi:glycerol-3-phosphate dehydrogenase subunit B
MRPDFLIRRWQSEAMAQRERLEVSPLWIHPDDSGPDWPLPALSTRYHAQEPFRSRLRELLDDRLHGSRFELLLFPPFFLDPRHADQLGRDLGIEVAEVLSTLEPTAGFRLRAAMSRGLARLGIDSHNWDQLQASTHEGRISGLRGYHPEKGWMKAEAQHYVLATGKYFSGGLALGYETITEPLFDLPLFLRRESREIRYRAEIPLSDRNFHEEQIWASLGVRVDEKWRPLDRNRAPVFANLSACGSIIGGVDAARSGLGLGFMAYSGRQNGKRVP